MRPFEGRNAEGSFQAGGPRVVGMFATAAVSPHDLSPLSDRTLKLKMSEKLHEAVRMRTANKGGTALTTPFADESWQRALLVVRKGDRHEQRIGKDLRPERAGGQIV